MIANTEIEWRSAEKHTGWQGPTARPKGVGLRVLLAESDAGNAECTSLLLSIDGHEVQIARNGLSALQRALADPPDVVLLEIRLAGMDGWELARRLREQTTEKKPFCVAYTTCGTEADRRRSQEAGIDLHLVKPLAPGSLRPILRRLQSILRPAEGVPEETTDSTLGRSPCPAVA